MDNRRWSQIEDILQRALDLEPHHRDAFVRETCEGDTDLRKAVETLLSREQDARSFLESSPLLRKVEESPSQVSHYRIEGFAGEGGMGKVFKARDETLGRIVALKMLPSEFTSDLERVQRFEQEAFAASRLNHPNIITIFEIAHADDNHFIAEEFVQGSTLRELLIDPYSKEPRPLKLEQALDIAIQIAAALKAAHTAWIIHRDIKPENVMVREDGLVKVLDFGIAKLGQDREHAGVWKTNDATTLQNPSLTIPGVIMGTASYMSPEQARGEQLDGRTDLFSLGLLLYEMVSGVSLFVGRTRADVLEVEQTNALISKIRIGHRPKELQRILRRSLKYNKEERYASADEFFNDLKKLKHRLANRTTRRVVGFSALAAIAAIAVTILAAFLAVTETWEETILRDGHAAAVRRAVFSPDGKWLVSVSEDHQVIVWDFTKRMRLKTLTEHTGPVTTVAFSPDGRWFVTGGEDQNAILWNAERLEKEAVWHDQAAPIVTISFSPDGALLSYATGSVVVIRETKSWTKVKELPCGIGAHGNYIFIENNRLLADNHGNVWNLPTGEMVIDAPEEWYGNWVAISPDSTRWVAADAEGNVKFLDLLGKRFIRQEHGHHDHGRAVAYSPDGKLIATGAERVLLWDALTMTKIAPLEYESVVWSVDFSPDARWLVSTHGDGSILIWDVLNRELRANLRQHSGGVRAVAFSPDGKRLVTASEDQSVILWNSENGRKEAVLTEHRTRVGAAIFAPDGRWIVSSDQSGILARHYLGESFARQLTRTPIGRPSYCLAVSPDGRFVATSFLVYDTVNGAPAFLPPLEWHAIYGAAFTPDGKLVVFVTDFGEVLIVDTSNWQLIERQRWTESPIVSLSISADGNRIVTGEDGKTVRLGTIRPLQQLGVIGQHSARVKAVAFSPDGKHVASAGDDKIVALWDVRRRKRVTTIGSHTSPIYALAFSPDGQRLVSGEHDRSVRQYRRHRSLWGFSLD